MPDLMKAAVVNHFGEDLTIEKFSIPQIQPHQILVKIMASGVCHTDLHAACGDWPIKPNLPFIPGHEGAGIVTQVGANVKNIKKGDRVGIPWLHTACGTCEYCLSEWETLCPKQKNTGYSINGCFAEYVVADPDYVAHLPAELSFSAAASILCAGLTAYKGIKETETKPGEWLVVIGIGGLGHMAVQFGKALGLKIIAIDIHEKQLNLAEELHADMIINAAIEDPVNLIQKKILGAHGVLATSVSPNSFSQAMQMLKPKGTACIVGLPPGEFKLSIFDLVLHRKTVRGSIVGTRKDLAECLKLAAENAVNVHYSLDSLENINHIFEKMKTGKILGRILIKM